MKKTHNELIEQFRGNLKKVNKKEIIKVPQKNVKVIKLNNKINDEITQHTIFHNDLQDLCKLHEDVQICVNFFQREETNEKIANLWGKENLQNYKTQCENLKSEIENFAAENSIDLDQKCFNTNQQYTIADIKQKMKSLEIKTNGEQNEYLLTNDMTYRQKYILIQRLSYLQNVLENIDKNIGEFQGDESLIQTFMELKEDLQFLRIEEMKKNNQKLSLIARELNKNYIDRRMNYFNHLQKNEFKKMFIQFDETKKSDESEDPEQVFQTFIQNQENLEKAAKLYNKLTLAKNLLAKYQQSSEDNYQYLRLIKSKIKEALETEQQIKLILLFL